MLFSCFPGNAASVAGLFFDRNYVANLAVGPRRSLLDLAIADNSIAANALAAQLVAVLEDENEPVYRSRYLLLMAERLLAEKIVYPALFFLEEVLASRVDAYFSDIGSIRQQALVQLATFTPSPFLRSDALTELLANYSLDELSKARWYYVLGQSLEDIERWDESMAAYQNFSNYPEINIPGVNDAHIKVRSKLSIYNSKREWRTFADLDLLVAEIRYVVKNRLGRRINSYLANDFFAISGNFTNDNIRRGEINLPRFLDPKVEFGYFTQDSNDREAWLETYNWPLAISRWYLYFRRIDYPADPQLDGKWEWAGIFIGDLL